MSMWCKVFGHSWRLHGGVAKNAGPYEHPANAQWGCDRCGERYCVEGVSVRMVLCYKYRHSPKKAERELGGVRV